MEHRQQSSSQQGSGTWLTEYLGHVDEKHDEALAARSRRPEAPSMRSQPQARRLPSSADVVKEEPHLSSPPPSCPFCGARSSWKVKHCHLCGAALNHEQGVASRGGGLGVGIWGPAEYVLPAALAGRAVGRLKNGAQRYAASVHVERETNEELSAALGRAYPLPGAPDAFHLWKIGDRYLWICKAHDAAACRRCLSGRGLHPTWVPTAKRRDLVRDAERSGDECYDVTAHVMNGA